MHELEVGKQLVDDVVESSQGKSATKLGKLKSRIGNWEKCRPGWIGATHLGPT